MIKDNDISYKTEAFKAVIDKTRIVLLSLLSIIASVDKLDVKSIFIILCILVTVENY